MADPRVTNLARTLVRYSVKVQPGELVGIVSELAGAPLIEQVYREVLEAGGIPHVEFLSQDLDYLLHSLGNDVQLQSVPPLMDLAMREFPVYMRIRAFTNTRHLSGADPARQSQREKAYGPSFEAYRERYAAGKMRWVVTLFPTDAYAQDAEMGTAEFEDYVYSATYSDTDDPVKEWKRMHDKQQRIVDHLNGKKQVVVKGPNVDLSLSIEGRSFINSAGLRNMPCGEVFTSPVEDSAQGWIRFTDPAVTRGREVEGIELRLEKGRVVHATATKNEAFMLSLLDMDEGARYLGEFAIGTNKKIDRFIKNILFDEKIGGTIHLAVGSGFREIGGQNKSTLHWDMICDMRDGGTIHVDDELIYESGEFKL